MEGVQSHTFSNGFKMIYFNAPYFKTNLAHLVVGVGSGCEKNSQRGISHLIEHLAFGKYREHLSIIDDINASTDVSTTTYEASFLPEKLNIALDGLEKLVTYAPIKNQNIIEREKEVIDVELREELDRDGSMRDDILYKTLFKQNPSAYISNKSILGTAESLKKINQKDLEKYFKRFYTRDNMILFLVGNLPTDIEKIVGKHFDNKNGNFKPFKYKPEQKLIGRNQVSIKGSQNKSSIIMAWQVPPIQYSEVSIPLSLAVSIISGKGDIHNGLETRLRDDGLIYSFSEDYSTDYEAGIYELETHCRPGMEKEIENRVLEAVAKIQSGNIGKRFFERQKKRGLYYLLREFDGIDGMMEIMKKETKYGIDANEEIKKTEMIEQDKIQEASKLINTENYAVLFETPTGEII